MLINLQKLFYRRLFWAVEQRMKSINNTSKYYKN